MKLVFVLLVTAFLAFVFTGCEALKTPAAGGPCVSNGEVLKQQLDLQLVEQKVRLEVEQTAGRLRLQVVEACVKRGRTPMFIGGNIECRADDKK